MTATNSTSLKPALVACFAALFALLATPSTVAQEENLRLENWEYPFPEYTYQFKSQLEDHEMVYMDLFPESTANGETVVLLHGKNFSGSYFEETATALSESGYRVLIPDQIGFGKSTKPEHYHYTFQQLAINTMGLLQSLEIESAHMLGHSMGGMLATRFALLYPDYTESLTLLNPIGLEDWKALGVPYRPVEAWYQQELQKTAKSIKEYQLKSYYDGKWKPAYDPWVNQLASYLESPDYARMAWNQALTYDMIFTQPVVYELPKLKMPTLLIIGQRDRTALGKDVVNAKERAKLGDYEMLGKLTQQAIPESQLVELDGIGHLPHIEAFDRFIEPYTQFLLTHANPEAD
ncbi:alpha/beta hydrolase [Pelagicoccus sp. SDUM812002]|uniref:alpha/beta fold hydrolase n=1 Tax=Pelagicoccus sp. SDUM812002 TaxID=3041266 RepID=UPI00280C6058|nr:alpha/beta hydrolase [Pelagicoccus sp. SDUM812002]MDQ8185082.1 alpha/beta hydrolase [Pelagicoccus sp. SDUM812002]